MKPVRGNTRSTGADEAGVQKVSARTLSRTFVQGPGQGQGLTSLEKMPVDYIGRKC